MTSDDGKVISMLNKEKQVNVIIDNEKCTKCGQCVALCPEYLGWEDKEIRPKKDSPYGCLQCGHCMMVCPNNAIFVEGEGISANDLVSIDRETPDNDSLNALFFKRRSIRKFKNQQVSNEIIDKILEAAATAPVGIPPSEVKVLIINGNDKVQVLASDLSTTMEKMLSKLRPNLLKYLNPLIGENAQFKMLKDFFLPLLKFIVDERKNDKDFLFYNAPTVIIFYGTDLSSKEDQILTSSYAAMSAESLGLGTCIIGSVAPFFERDKKLKEKYGISKGDIVGTAFILGYPDVKFNKGIKRRFKDVKYYN